MKDCNIKKSFLTTVFHPVIAGSLLASFTQAFANQLLPMGLIQGDPGISQSPTSTFPSPKLGQTLSVQGTLTQIVHWKSHADGKWGFFLQNTPEESDQNPSTSDGLFIHTKSVPRGRNQNGRSIPLTQGQRVRVTGSVFEHYGMTELTQIQQITILNGEPNPHSINPIPVYPPDDFVSARLYWEAREGMLVQIPPEALLISGLKIYRNQESLLWFIHPEHPIAKRRNILEQRVFRDFHPLDDVSSQRFDNKNGYRMIISSLGLHRDETAVEPLLPLARTGDRIDSPWVGPVFYSYGTYRIASRDLPRVRSTGPPEQEPFIRPQNSFSIATLNCKNLYDFRDDPTDPCDFIGNPGTRYIRPPFDYLPVSEEDYTKKLTSLARQTVDHLYSPQLLLLQEIEDQDAFPVADGQNDILNDVIREISRIGGPTYASASDTDGADSRGIHCAYLYQPSHLTLVEPDPRHGLLGTKLEGINHDSFDFNSNVQNPKAFNFYIQNRPIFSRPVQLGIFRFTQQPSTHDPTLLYVLNNHFKSVPERSIENRKREAALNATLISMIKENDPDPLVVMGGDLNTYPRPDDPVPEEPTDTLKAIYESRMVSLFDRVLNENPAAAYTYVYQGESGILDHLFVSTRMNRFCLEVRIPHVNADWPDDFNHPQGYGCSDHDPVLALFKLPW